MSSHSKCPDECNFDYDYYASHNNDISRLANRCSGEEDKRKWLWQHWKNYGRDECRPHRFVECKHTPDCCPDMAIGPQGPQGRRGPKGEKGCQGDTGPQGKKGDKGCQGDKGDTGDTGPQGAFGGPQGPQGKDGEDGEDGRDGEDGSDGPQGSRGPQGPDGETGPQGEAGVQFKCISGMLRGITVQRLSFGKTKIGAIGDKEGDLCLDLSNGTLYCWDGMNWEICNPEIPYYYFDINSSVIYCVDGRTLPVPTLKEACDLSPGDQVLDDQTGNLYGLQEDCTWRCECNLRGPQGPDGKDGPQGCYGPQGPQGLRGPQGTLIKCLDHIIEGKTIQKCSSSKASGDYHGQLCLSLSDGGLFQWNDNDKKWEMPIDNPPEYPFYFRDPSQECAKVWCIMEECQPAVDLIEMCDFRPGDVVINGETGDLLRLGWLLGG